MTQETIMTEDTNTNAPAQTDSSAFTSGKAGGHPVRVGVSTANSNVGRAGAPVRTSSAPTSMTSLPSMPGWAVALSVFWVSIAFGYLFASGGFSGGAGAVGGIIAGIAAPLVVIWLIAFMQQRTLEVDIITQPIRRQLNALLSPSATTDVRIRRITEALAEQAEMLRNAANVALEDSSAAMTAITRQSGELRRLSAEAMLDIGKVGKTAEQTLSHLRETLGQLTGQTSSEREKALAMVADLEKNFTAVLGQLDKVSQQYEGKLGRLNETSGQIEARTKNLLTLTTGIDEQVDAAAGHVLGDLTRLESAVVELSQRSAAIAHLLERPVDSLERAAGQLDAHLRQSHNLLSSATQNLEKIGDVVMGRANNLVAGLSDRLSSMELVGAKLVSLGAAAQSDTGRFVGEIERVAERIRDYGSESEAKLRSVLAEFTVTGERVHTQGDSLVSRLSEGVSALASAVNNNDDRFAELADGIEERATRLRELGRDARGQLEDAQLALSGAYDGLEGQIDRLGQLTTRLQGEVGRADASAAAMSGVTEQARVGASSLLNLSEKTTDVLGMIAHALESQQQQVGTLADDLTGRVQKMQAELKAQRDELARTGSDLSTQSEVAKLALREQVGAIGAASMDAAGKLDVLEQRVNLQVNNLSTLATSLGSKLEQLVASVQTETGVLSNANAALTTEQKSLLDGALAAQQQLGKLTEQLQVAQSSATESLSGVGQRLAALRQDLAAAEQDLRSTSGNVDSAQASLQQRSEGLSGALRETLGRLESLTSQSETTHSKMVDLRTELQKSREALAHENVHVQEQLQALQAEMAREQAQLERVKAEASTATTLWQQAQAQLEGSEAQLKTSSLTAQAELGAITSRLGNASQDIASASHAAGSAYAQLAQQSTQAQQRIVELERDLGSMQQLIVTLTERSDVLARAMAEQAAQAEIASGKLQGATAVAEAATAQLAKGHESLKASAQDQAAMLAMLQEQIAQAARELASQGELSQTGLQALVSGIAGATSALQSQAESHASAIGQSQSALIAIRRELGEQSSSIRADMGEIGSQMHSLKGELEMTSTQVLTVSAQMQEQAVQARGLREEVGAFASHADSATQLLTTRLRELAAAAAQQQDQASSLHMQLEQLSQSLSNSSAQGQAGIAALQEKLEAASALLASRSEAGLVALGSTQERIRDTADQTSVWLDRLTTQGAKVSETLEQAGAQGAALSHALDVQQGKLREVGSASETLAEQARAQLTALESGYASLKEIAGAAERQGTLGYQALVKVVQQMEESAAQARQQAEQVTSRLGAAGEQLTAQSGMASTQLGELQQAIMAAASAMASSISASQRELAEAMQQGEASFAQTAATTEAISQARSAELAALAMRLQTLGRDVTADIALLGEAGSGAATQIGRQRTELAQALSLIAELEQTSTTQSTQLRALAAQIAEQQKLLTEAGLQASVQQQQLAAQTTQAQSLLREMTEQVNTTRALVDATADHTATRLADVAADFTTRIREGEGVVQIATNRLREVEQRMAETGTQMEERQAHLMASTRELLQQLAAIDGSFDDVLSRSATVQTQLATQAEHNQRLVSGLAELGEMGTATLEEQSQRLARLASQAASDTQRLMSLGAQVQQQQDELTETARTAAAVLEVVQGKVLQATEAGHSQLEGAGEKVASLLTALTSRASELAQQNDSLSQQLRTTTAQMAQALTLLHEGGRKLGVDLSSVGEQLHSRALDVTAAGQQLDRELKTRLGSVQQTTQEVEGLYSKATQRLAELDSRSSQYLIELDRSSAQSFGRLQAGVDAFRDVPLQLREAEALLHTQVGTARQEVMRLRGDLVELGQSILAQADTAGETSSSWLRNLQQLSAQSSAMTGQIDEASTRMAQAAQQAWQLVHQAVAESTAGLAGLHENLQGAESRSSALAQLAKQGIEGLLERVAEMGQTIETALAKANRSYAELAGGGLQQIEVLSQTLAQSADALESSSTHAHERLLIANQLATQHQTALNTVAGTLSSKLQDVRNLLETVQQGLGGLDARIEHLAPNLSAQDDRLQTYIGTIDRTLNQVTSLQNLSRDMAHEHSSLALQLQQQELALRGVASELDTRFSAVEQRLSQGVLSQISTAAEQAQSVERTLMSLMQQAQMLDQTIASIRSGATDQTTDRLLNASTALVSAHTQLQRSAQLSESGLLQSQEETQRLTARMEQMRALLRSLTGAIAADLSEWQNDMRKRLTGIAGELSAPAVRANAPLPAMAPARVTVSTSSTQLTTEALQAVAVDLYRLLRTEVPELLKGLPAPAARRGPMGPGEARTYTVGLLELAAGIFSQYARGLYQTNLEFRQYVDRYLTRFEAHYDILARAPQGLEEAKAYRASEVGRLYSLLSGAIERKTVAITDVSAAG
jgi:chromosome segregation ATPase